MKSIIVETSGSSFLSPNELKSILESHFENIKNIKNIENMKTMKTIKKILLIPPDITRSHSGAGIITSLYYEMFTKAGIEVNVLPALGSHFPMTRAEQLSFFGDIPEDRFLAHDWRTGVTTLGEIPSSLVKEASEGLLNMTIPVEVSNHLVDPSYDLIISIGQVVPHEVVGMANYTKNIVVGCGGSGFINASHMVGAFYGIERILGKTDSPVRRLFDYAEENFIKKLPLHYVLTVTDFGNIIGLYIGTDRDNFVKASALSAKRNIIYVDKPIKKCVVSLDGFHSTWVGNKAIYRTRMAIADGGDLIILAPDLNACGEDDENDRLIRKYGYIGRTNVLELCKTEPELQNNLSAAAHLIHGSADGRFNVTYVAPKLGEEVIKKIGYQYMDWDEAIKKYDPKKLKPGLNRNFNGSNDSNDSNDSEDIYYISNPALGLWQTKPTNKPASKPTNKQANNPTNIKLLASDMDGTLLNNDHKMSDRTANAIKSWLDAGLYFIPSTGRPLCAMGSVAGLFKKDMPFIVYNGAKAVMHKSGEELFSITLSPDIVPEIVQGANGRNLPCIIWCKDKLYANRDDQFTRMYQEATEAPAKILESESELQELAAMGVTKVLWMDYPQNILKHQSEMRKHYGKRVNCHASRPEMLEFVDPAASKALALEKIGQKLGVKQEEIAAVGDGYNDLSMLQYAGFSIAMGNAPDDIKVECDHVTLDNDAHGVAVWMEGYLK